MKLKETLNLGKTAFPMRAGLPNKEPIWQKSGKMLRYQRRQELNEGNLTSLFMMVLRMPMVIFTRWTCDEQDF